MGKGAYVTIQNETSNELTTECENKHCMFDGGKEGSNLSNLEGSIASGGSLPNAGGRQYIEAKASGGCFFGSSSFQLYFSAHDETFVNITLIESGNVWSVDHTYVTKGNLAVTTGIEKDGSQYRINIVATNT